MEYIKLKDLVQHRDLQVREALDEDRIKFLATVFEGWDPLIAYKVDGKLYLADGYHRYAAARYAGLQEIPVEIREGTFRDALQCTLTVNAGSRIKPLTLRERNHGCYLMLKIWTERSDRWIAEDMGLNHETVRGQRETMEATGEIRQLDRLLGKDGKWRPRIRKPVEPKVELPASIPQSVTRNHPVLDLMEQGKPIRGTLRMVRVQHIKVCWDYFPRKKLDNDMLRVLRVVKPDAIPPVLVNQDLVLIDGYTRMTLHQMTKRKEVEVEVVECPEDRILLLAAYLNAGPDRGQGPHDGQPLGIRDLRQLVIRLARGGMPPEKIAAELELRRGDVNRWVIKDSRARMRRATSLPKTKDEVAERIMPSKV